MEPKRILKHVSKFIIIGENFITSKSNIKTYLKWTYGLFGKDHRKLLNTKSF